MREEIKNWWKQSQADLRSAGNSFNSGDYYLCVFMCQQAAEKGLKTLSLLKLKSLQAGHSLIFLAKELKVPGEIFKDVQSLNPEYITTRYPDVANAAPVDIYNESIAKSHLAEAKRILGWLKNQIRE